MKRKKNTKNETQKLSWFDAQFNSVRMYNTDLGLGGGQSQVQVENDSVLKISGERRRDDFATDTEIKYVRVERSAGKFMRKFNLPANANLDGISAACQDGLLTVIVPKNPPPDPHRPRTFDVNVGSTSVAPP